MSKRSEKKLRRSPRRDRSVGAPRGGVEIPRKTSIVATDTLVSPKGQRYAILETDQVDPYDKPAGKEKKRQ
jgi:hypothetical protein